MAVTNPCALGAALVMLAGMEIPINNKANMNKLIKRVGRIFIGGDYISNIVSAIVGATRMGISLKTHSKVPSQTN